MFFFLFTASSTSSLHHVLPCSLHFLFSQSSHKPQTLSLNKPHKSLASVLTSSFTLSLNFSLVSFPYNFYILHYMFRFMFMHLNRIFFFISTTTNHCCSFLGITLKSFKNFLLFPLKQNQFQFHYHLNCKSPVLFLKPCICHT